MHTLRDGMDVLPRSFVNKNLWGPQSRVQSNDLLLTQNIFYNNMVYKIEYNEDGVIVHSRDNFTSKAYQVKGDYVLVTVPLPIIQDFDFEPSISSFKQEAIRSTRYEATTKYH